MIRQLPTGFALVIRGGCAPVVAKLPRAWKDRTYRRGRRRGYAIATLAPAAAPAIGERPTWPNIPARPQPAPAETGPAVTDAEMPPDPFPPGTSFPWN